MTKKALNRLRSILYPSRQEVLPNYLIYIIKYMTLVHLNLQVYLEYATYIPHVFHGAKKSIE